MNSVLGSGRVQAGETDMWLRPARGFQDDGHRAAIYCHQGGATGISPANAITYPGTSALLASVADAGYPVASSDLGGLSLWGNSTAQTRTGQLTTWARGTVGGSSDAVVAIGISMGFAAAVNYFSAHTSDVAAFIGVLPVWNLTDIYTNNVLGAQAAIGTAWGVTYPDPLPAGASPHENASSLAGKPCLIFFASDDDVCDATIAASIVSTFGANAASVNLGALGHTDTAVAAINKQTVSDFLRSYA